MASRRHSADGMNRHWLDRHGPALDVDNHPESASPQEKRVQLVEQIQHQRRRVEQGELELKGVIETPENRGKFIAATVDRYRLYALQQRVGHLTRPSNERGGPVITVRELGLTSILPNGLYDDHGSWIKKEKEVHRVLDEAYELLRRNDWQTAHKQMDHAAAVEKQLTKALQKCRERIRMQLGRRELAAGKSRFKDYLVSCHLKIHLLRSSFQTLVTTHHDGQMKIYDTLARNEHIKRIARQDAHGMYRGIRELTVHRCKYLRMYTSRPRAGVKPPHMVDQVDQSADMYGDYNVCDINLADHAAACKRLREDMFLVTDMAETTMIHGPDRSASQKADVMALFPAELTRVEYMHRCKYHLERDRERQLPIADFVHGLTQPLIVHSFPAHMGLIERLFAGSGPTRKTQFVDRAIGNAGTRVQPVDGRMGNRTWGPPPVWGDKETAWESKNRRGLRDRPRSG